jgi:hypothetical protein
MENVNFRLVDVPNSTSSYVAISHGELVDLVKENIDKSGLIIKDEKIKTAKFGQQLFGTITVGANNVEQDMTIGFRNSYDKSITVGIVAGNRVIVCENLMFKGDFKVMRKHTGHVKSELEFLVANGVNTMNQQFVSIIADTEKMKQVQMTKRATAELIGRMYIEEKLITSTQLNIIADQLTNSKHFKDDSLWSLYNHTTEALKTAHPVTIINDHIKIHDFYKQLC